MVIIAGETAPDELVGDPRPSFLSDNETAVTGALLRCMGRWGLTKTTIEDVAREAGVSRATVYRLFPGGKQAILDAAAQAEVRLLLTELSDALVGLDDLEECLVAAVNLAACFLEAHEALGFMRAHEPVALEQVLAFDRLDTLFAAVGEMLRPVLGRFLPEDRTAAVGVWLARIVVSYLTTPSTDIDLCEPADVRFLVRTFVMPGLATDQDAGPGIDLRRTESPIHHPIQGPNAGC